LLDALPETIRNQRTFLARAPGLTANLQRNTLMPLPQPPMRRLARGLKSQIGS